MKLSVGLRDAVAGWVFFIFFGALLYLFDGKTYGNLYQMIVVKDMVGLLILILAGYPVGYLISQVSWFMFSLWPLSFKFPWAITSEFQKAKNEGIAEDSQSDHQYFKDADAGMVEFNRTMTSFYSQHMDAITAIIAAFICIYLRIFQIGLNVNKILKYPGASKLILLFVMAAVIILIALVFNARNCRRDLIDQKRLWNKDKLTDKAKYIHINPSIALVILAVIVALIIFKAFVWWEIFLLILLYIILSFFSLYKVSI